MQDLMVHPDYQHMGIATNLMNRMIEYLKGNMIFMISVIYDKKLKPFMTNLDLIKAFADRCRHMRRNRNDKPV